MSTFDELKAKHTPSQQQRKKCQIELLNAFIDSFDSVMRPEANGRRHKATIIDKNNKNIYSSFKEWLKGPYGYGYRYTYTYMNISDECLHVLNRSDIEDVGKDLQILGFDVRTVHRDRDFTENNLPTITLITDLSKRYS